MRRKGRGKGWEEGKGKGKREWKGEGKEKEWKGIIYAIV